MSRSFSYLPAGKIKIACRDYLGDRDRKITAKREKMILQKMKPRWFRAPRTKEQAIKALLFSSSRTLISDWHRVELVDRTSVLRVKELLRLCEIVGEDKPVHLSASDSMLLKQFLVSNK